MKHDTTKKKGQRYSLVRFTVFFRIIQQDLSYRDACVLGTLIEHADAGDLTTREWLRMVEIAERIGTSERTVQRAIEALIQQGWITVVKGRHGRDPKGTPTSNLYTLGGVKTVCDAWLESDPDREASSDDDE